MVVVVNDPLGRCDLDLGGLILVFLVFASLATIRNLLGRGLHVDRCLFFTPSCLHNSINVPFSCHYFDLGGLSLAFLVTACDPPNRNPHVGCHLPSPPSWL